MNRMKCQTVILIQFAESLLKVMSVSPEGEYIVREGILYSKVWKRKREKKERKGCKSFVYMFKTLE